MRSIVIYERDGWRLTSFGNGWAYQLDDMESGTSAWFQDDDAREFASRVMDSDGWLVDNCAERFADYSEVMTKS